jgi:hypothetical protein
MWDMFEEFGFSVALFFAVFHTGRFLASGLHFPQNICFYFFETRPDTFQCCIFPFLESFNRVERSRVRTTGLPIRDAGPSSGKKLYFFDLKGQFRLGVPPSHNIKMDLREVGWGGMDWINLDRDRWRALVNAVMNLWVP